MVDQKETCEFGKEYSEERFWEKVKKYAKVAGREVIEKALSMYYALRDKDTPLWAKTIIIGALAYFIMPLDAIPDVIPAAGYTDDLGVLAASFTAVAFHVKPEHTAAAKEKLKQWFS